MKRMIKRAPWIAIGAGAAYLFDPERGRLRRKQAKAKIEGIVHGDAAGVNGAASDAALGDGAPLSDAEARARAQR